MNMYDVVNKLVGPIDPVGDSCVDHKRLENLEEMTDLVNRLLTDIDNIAMANKGRHEASMKKAGVHCDEFLTALGINE